MDQSDDYGNQNQTSGGYDNSSRGRGGDQSAYNAPSHSGPNPNQGYDNASTDYNETRGGQGFGGNQGAGYNEPSPGTIYNDPNQGAGYNDPNQGAGYSNLNQGAGYSNPNQGAGYSNPNQGAGYSNPNQGAGGGHQDPYNIQSTYSPNQGQGGRQQQSTGQKITEGAKDLIGKVTHRHGQAGTHTNDDNNY